MQGHVIVCGFGQVGDHITKLLRALGEEVTVITLERADTLVRISEAEGVNVQIGDGRDEKVMRKAGLETAKALIVCTTHDSLNLQIGLDAKRINPAIQVVVRIFDLALAIKLDQLFDLTALATSEVAASAFAAAAFGELAVAEFSLDGDRMLVLALRAEGERRSLIGKRIRDVAVTGGFPILLHVSAGEATFDPNPDTIVAEGDVLKVIGKVDEFRRARLLSRRRTAGRKLAGIFRPLNPFPFVSSIWRDTTREVRAAYLVASAVGLISSIVFAVAFKINMLTALYYVITTMTTVGYGDISPLKEGPPWAVGLACLLMINGTVWMVLMYVLVTDYLVSARLEQASRRGGPDEGHTVVVGIGDLGLRTTEDLVSGRLPVIVIDADGTSLNFKSALRRCAAVVGDARDPDILRRARVHRADAIIITTSDDATNLSVAVAAREINPDIRVVLRVFDPDFAQKLNESDAFDRVLSAAARSAPAFVGAALYPNALTSFVLNGCFLVLSSREADPGATTFRDRLEIQSRPILDSEAAKIYET